mgnify:CR=1 FL=1|tara:strand:+ start:352 stop:588 length:237 start_codon:yes stop_codon:yes gene_type:complete
MLKLSGSEIDFYASKIYETLEEIPLYYIEEIMELAFEDRRREGDIEGLDISSSEEENSESNESTTSDEEEKTSSSDDN